MNKLEIINSHIPICPECNGKMKINLVQSNVKCTHCGCIFQIIELGRNDRDFICERKENLKCQS